MAKRIDNIKELKGRSRAELLKNAMEKRERLHSLRTDLAAGKVKNVREIQSLKKDIARALTFLASAKQ